MTRAMVTPGTGGRAGVRGVAPTRPQGPSASTPAGLARLREAFVLPQQTESIALWGSSSMQGGLGAEHTPRPVYVHDELTLCINPRPVYALAYGAHTSRHTMIMRGLDEPYVRLPSGMGRGKVEVHVDTLAAPVHTFRCRGTLSSGTTGVLMGSKKGRWFFEIDDPASASSGHFISEWKRTTANSRHVVWTGKNNIHELDRVRRDIDSIVEAARDPQRDVIVLGQWVTLQDLDRPRSLENMRRLNNIHRERYGVRFIDVQALLTSEEALLADPLWELDLTHSQETRAEIEKGIVPAPLRGSDGIHLSGWGNLLVTRALVERMTTLGWM